MIDVPFPVILPRHTGTKLFLKMFLELPRGPSQFWDDLIGIIWHQSDCAMDEPVADFRKRHTFIDCSSIFNPLVCVWTTNLFASLSTFRKRFPMFIREASTFLGF